MSSRDGRAGQLTLLDDATRGAGSWRVRASDRARRLSVRVLPGARVEIVVPPGTRPRAIERFIASSRPWIDRKLAQYGPAEPADLEALPAVIRFTAHGGQWAVAYCEAPGAPRLSIDDGRLTLRGEIARRGLVRHALQRFAMRQAHAVLVPWLDRIAAASGLAYGRAQIRRQRTRWGSCSRRGTISLNVCLLFQPESVVRYLLIHELAHTQHLNHSRRFWGLVERLEPDWRDLDAELSRGWSRVPAWALR